MSGEMMTFPESPEEFTEQYSFTDKERVYTNGSELIPVFRVRQMLEHYTLKPMERIIERLEDKKWGTSEWRDKWRDEIIGECIEVVKEEGGIE